MGFGILDSVLAIWNNSGIANYNEMPIPTLVQERLLQLRTFHKWDSKYERSRAAGESDIGLCKVLV